jgi:hypothetical protein
MPQDGNRTGFQTIVLLLGKQALDKVQKKKKKRVCLFIFMLYTLLTTLGIAGHGLVWHSLVGPFIHAFKTILHIKDEI